MSRKLNELYNQPVKEKNTGLIIIGIIKANRFIQEKSRCNKSFNLSFHKVSHVAIDETNGDKMHAVTQGQREALTPNETKMPLLTFTNNPTIKPKSFMLQNKHVLKKIIVLKAKYIHIYILSIYII